MNAFNFDPSQTAPSTDWDINELVTRLGAQLGYKGRAANPKVHFKAADIDTAQYLVRACGVSAERANAMRGHEFVAFYNVALKSPEAARRMALKYADSQPAPAPYNPSPAPAGLSEYEIETLISNAMAGLAGDVLDQSRATVLNLMSAHENAIPQLVKEALEAIAPRPVTITVADLPPVTFQHTHPSLPRLMRKAANRKASWLVGPRGSGKSMAARQVASALGLSCHVMTGAEDATDIVGYIQPHDGTVKITPFRTAWVEGGVILLDEMDTYNPAALIVINDALANWECSFPDGSFKVHPDCIVIAGTNTDGRGATNDYSARSVIDASTRDRFAYIPWDYSPDMEKALGSANPAWTDYVQAVRAAMDSMAMGDTPSPRATIEGASDIAQGDSWEEVAESRIFKGLSPDYIKRINSAVNMETYRAKCPFSL
jgi:hypothetical protein